MIVEKGVVHVVDDDPSWRSSVERLMSAVGYRVVLYESAEQFLEVSKFESPGCMLLDLRMGGLSGLQLQQRLSSVHHSLAIVFLSGHADIPTSVLAVRTGAEDFLTKPVETEVLLQVIDRAVERSRGELDKRSQLNILRQRLATLTPSERKVFDLVVRGKLNKQIGFEMGTVERTIKWHRHNIMLKLQVQSVTELVLLAERLGLMDNHP